MAQGVRGEGRRRHDRLAVRIIAILIAASVLPVGGMALLADRMATDALVAARLDGLRQSANDGGEYVRHFVDGVMGDAAILQSTPVSFRQQASSKPGQVRDSEGLHLFEMLTGLMETRRIYESAALIDQSGKEIFRLNYSNGRVRGVELSALASHSNLAGTRLLTGLFRPQLVELDFDGLGRSTQNLTLLVPVGDSQQSQRGALVMTLSPQAVQRLLDDDHEMGGIQILWCDQDGKIIGGPQSESSRPVDRLSQLIGPEWQRVLGMEERVFPDIGGLALADATVEWDTTRVHYWKLMAFMPREVVLAPVRALHNAIFVLMAVLVGLAMLGGLLISRRLLIDPLGDLLAAMRRFRDGDLSVRAPQHAGELGELANSFNEMAGSLEASHHHMEGLVLERTKEVLRQSQERKRAEAVLVDAVESMQDAFLVFDAQDRLVLCNSKASRLVAPEVVPLLKPGLHIEDFLRAMAHSKMVTASLGRAEEWVAEQRAASRQTALVSVESLADGRWLENRSWRTVDGGSVTVLADITERKQAERALSISERRFHQLFENMQDAVMVLKAEENGAVFRVTDMNQAALVVERTSHDEVLGRTLDEAFPYLAGQGRLELIARVWRDQQPQRLSTFFVEDARQPGWRDMVLYPVEANEVVAVYRDVTAECQAEDALMRSEERYRTLIETMSEGLVVCDSERVISYVNERFAQLCGREPNQMIGLRLEEVFHEDYRERIMSNRSIAFARQSGGYEAVLDGGGSGMVEVLVSPAPFHDASGRLVGTMGIVTDISRLKKVQQALTESESRFRAIFEGAPFGMVLIGPDGLLAEANPAFLSMLRLPADQVLGHDPDEMGLEGLLACGDEGPNASSWEGEVQLQDGRKLTLRGHAAPVVDRLSGQTSIIATVEDISRAREMEERMSHSSKLMLLGEMSAGLAHEITQPLNVIRLTSEATLARIETGTVTLDEATGKLKIINDQADRLFDVIDYMQAFSRRESEKKTPFDLFTSIRAAVALLNEPFRQKKIAMDVRLPDAACTLLGHPRQLEQVIINLLTNAKDATIDKVGNAGGTILVSAEYEPGSSHVVVRIQDQGTGIPEEIRQRIFEPFFSTKGPGKGTGLGLSISLGIVSNLGGDMYAENAEEGGARFVLDLPLPVLEPMATPLESPCAAEPVSMPAAQREQAHLMVVDDEELAASEMADFLRRVGYRVSVFHGGEAALKAFPDNPADLVVTDLNMPDGDGRMLIDGLMADYPYLPIIVVTGRPNAKEGDLDEAAAGADVVLRKPVRLRDLAREIEQLLV